jgi:hypothetical protein
MEGRREEEPHPATPELTRSASDATALGLFFLSGLLFLDPMTDGFHFPVVQIQESDADSFRTGPLGRIKLRPGNFTRATDPGFVVRKNKFDREPFAGMEGTFRGHGQTADADILHLTDEYLVVFFPPHFQYKQRYP